MANLPGRAPWQEAELQGEATNWQSSVSTFLMEFVHTTIAHSASFLRYFLRYFRKTCQKLFQTPRKSDPLLRRMARRSPISALLPPPPRAGRAKLGAVSGPCAQCQHHAWYCAPISLSPNVPSSFGRDRSTSVMGGYVTVQLEVHHAMLKLSAPDHAGPRTGGILQCAATPCGGK